MNKLILNPESVAAYKTLMTEPTKHGLDIPPLCECFKEAEEATARHILFDEYIKKVNKPVPKVMFYIIMDEIYRNQIAKAPDGNMGWKLKITINAERGGGG